MATNPKLIVLSESLRGLAFELRAERYVVGRAESCDICIPDPTMSSKHCFLVRNGAGEYEVQDQGSTNGSYINGAGIRNQVLVNNDILKLGSIELRYDAGAQPVTLAASARFCIPVTASAGAPPARELVPQPLPIAVMPVTRGPVPDVAVVQTQMTPGMILDEHEFRDALRRVVKGAIGVVALVVLKGIAGSFLRMSASFGGMRLTEWLQTIFLLAIVGFLIEFYRPAKSLAAFYLMALVKAGKMPGRDRYLGNFVGVAEKLTLLLFAGAVYGVNRVPGDWGDSLGVWLLGYFRQQELKTWNVTARDLPILRTKR